MEYFYTYLMHDPVANMGYIGSRYAEGITDPEADLEVYRGSSSVEGWDDVIAPRCECHVLMTFIVTDETRDEVGTQVLENELMFQKKFNVVESPDFYNKSYAKMGFSAESCSKGGQNQKSNKGKRHVYNPTTDHGKTIPRDEPNPQGYKSGRKSNVLKRQKILTPEEMDEYETLPLNNCRKPVGQGGCFERQNLLDRAKYRARKQDDT